jgi:CHAT domain-containing protein
MSLWPVGDLIAREWMRVFYEDALLEGMGTMHAVRSASLELLRVSRDNGQGDHPAHWAPFVAVGRWH